LTVAAGCKPGPRFTFAPVEGTVTKGGKPLSDVLVIFYCDADTPGPRSVSEPTDAEGHFRMHTDAGDDGAVVGRHRVCVVDPRDLGAAVNERRKALLARSQQNDPAGNAEALKALGSLKPAPPRVPPAYARMGETPLRVEVRPEPQAVQLEVK
jgi:hypothetical protein